MHPKTVLTTALSFVSWLAPAALADVTYTPVTEPDGALTTTVIRMTVTPAPEPVPALRHRLIARDIDLKPGNAAPGYYRAIMAMRREREQLLQKFDEDTQLDPWLSTDEEATPLTELPLEQVRRAVQLSTGLQLGQELADATSRRDCDWQLGIEDVRGPEVIAYRLEEFQQSRQMSRWLSLRTRLAVAEGRYDDAIDAMRMNYRLARDVASEPFLVCGLVGLAQVRYANGNLIELIAAPDSPNMYWALTEMPRPLVDLRPAARFENGLGLRIFPFMQGAETADRSPDEWNRLYKESFRNFMTVGRGGTAAAGFHNELAATAFALLGYPHAKERLIAQGLERDDVERLPVGQVLAIYTERTYQRLADDMEKLWYVPFPELRARRLELDERVQLSQAFSGGADREILPIASLLLPATQAARTAQVRTERDMAAMRVIEALRMYAAEHEGRLPANLDAITAVPVPLNPATGKPFEYRLDGDTAILELPPSDGIPNYNRRFEISIHQQ